MQGQTSQQQTQQTSQQNQPTQGSQIQAQQAQPALSQQQQQMVQLQQQLQAHQQGTQTARGSAPGGVVLQNRPNRLAAGAPNARAVNPQTQTQILQQARAMQVPIQLPLGTQANLVGPSFSSFALRFVL